MSNEQMGNDETLELRELTIQEQRDIDGGVTEGGCIDPLLKKIIDALTVGTP